MSITACTDPIETWDEWPADTAVVIGCSDAKADEATTVDDLYRSSFFALALKAARALVPDEQIRVLSARHGLVALDEIIDPYDTRWGDDDAIDTDDLAAQLGWLAATHSVVVSMTAKAYTGRIGASIDVVDVFDGNRGIGDHRHDLSAAARLVDATR